MKNQRGVSLVALMFVVGLVIVLALMGIKLFPDAQEYWAAVKVAKATAMDPGSRTASVADIRLNFDKRRSIDNISAVTGADLDISKEGNDIVIAFAYTRRIPLYGPVSLMIDFEGSSAQ